MKLRLLLIAGWMWMLVSIAHAASPAAAPANNTKAARNQTLPANAIARVNNAILLYSTFNARWRGFVRRVPPHMRSNLKLKKRFLNHMIDGLVLSVEARRQGKKISKQKVFGFLKRVRYFLNKQGQLDMRMLKMIVTRYYRMSVPQYIEQLRRDMLAAQMRRGFMKSIQFSPASAKQVFLAENRQLRVRWIALDRSKVQWTQKPSAAALQTLLKKENKALQTWYKAHTSLYQRKEQIHARHLMLSTRGKSEAVVRKQLEALRQKLLAKPALFATFASQHSQALDKSKGGDLGWFARGEMVAPFEKAAFAMKKTKGISGIVKTRFGLHIIQFLGRKAGSNSPFSDSKVQKDVAFRVWRERSIDAQLKTSASALLAKLSAGTKWTALLKSIKGQKKAPSTRPTTQAATRPVLLPAGFKNALTHGTSKFVGKGDDVFLGEKLTDTLVDKFFALTSKQPLLKTPLQMGSRLMVVQFFKDRDPGEKGWAMVKSRWIPRYKRRFRQKRFSTWVKGLRKKTTIQVNWAALKR